MAQATRGTPGSLDFGTRTSPSLPASDETGSETCEPRIHQTVGRGGGGVGEEWEVVMLLRSKS